MKFTLEEQFEGFLETPQIFTEKAILEYPLYQTNIPVSGDKASMISTPTATVLGKRMEHFFACYVSRFTSEEIIAQNQQIIREKETLGELDFLLKNSTSGETSHVELIYKFYLFDPATGNSELDHLIGPNKRDSLNRKLERLQKRQFPLLFNQATKELLDSLDIDSGDVIQKMCFKASVFLPKKMGEVSFDHINHDTIAGFWIKASDFTHEDYGEDVFFSPGKKYWPVLPKYNKSWYSFEEIKKQIDPLLMKKFAPLLWMKTPGGDHKRFFIVWW